MKLALGLVVGYLIGSKMLDGDYGDVTRALRAVGQSDELRDVIHTVRVHAGQTLRDVADLLENPGGRRDEDLVERVTDLQARRGR